MSEYTLIRGDCLKVFPTIPSESIDLMVTDPPFGVSFQSNFKKQKFNKILNDDNLDWYEGFIKESYRVLKNNTHTYIFTRWDVYPQQYEVIKKYFNIKNLLVIKKRQSLGDLKGSFMPNFGLIIFCQKGRRTFNTGIRRVSQTTLKDSRYKGDGYLKRYPALLDFLVMNEFNLKLVHPTQKALDTIEFLVKISSDKGDVVFDPFLGSGTTMHASKNLERSCIGIEINQEYCDIVAKRCGVKIQGSVTERARELLDKSVGSLKGKPKMVSKDETWKDFHSSCQTVKRDDS